MTAERKLQKIRAQSQIYVVSAILAVARRPRQILGFLDVPCGHLTSKKVICPPPDQPHRNHIKKIDPK